MRFLFFLLIPYALFGACSYNSYLATNICDSVSDLVNDPNAYASGLSNETSDNMPASVVPDKSFYYARNGVYYYEQYNNTYTADNGATLRNFSKYTFEVAYCGSGTVYDSTSGSCVSTCQPLSFFVENLDSTTCVGSVSDYNLGVSGQLSYQQCDNTCYIIEVQPLSCKDMRDHFQPFNLKKCDLDLNKYEDNCTAGSVTTDSSGNTVVKPTSYSFTCTPLGSRVSPCNIERNKMDCGPGYKVAGTCHDNGSFVTEDTLYCKEITNSPDDCDPNTEKWDATKKSCVCADGFVSDAYGSCWLPENTGGSDPNGGNLDQNSSLNDLVREQKNHKLFKEMNEKLGNIDSDLNQTNDLLKSQADTLSSIRGDLNVSNHLLNKISDALNGSGDSNSSFSIDSSDLDDYSSYIASVTDQFTTFKTNVLSQIDEINTQYENAKNIFSTSHNAPSFSGSYVPESASVLGNSVSFDLCPFFSKLQPIIFFLLNLYFMFLVTRFTFINLLRSFR